MSNQSYHTSERNELIESHMNLVHWVIKNSFSVPSQDVREELISIGYEALIEAADKFDPERGKFLTLAVLKIRSRIWDHFRNNRRREAIVSFLSLDKPVNEDEEGTMTYHEVFEDEDAQHEETTVSQMYVDYLLSNLGKRDRRFISLNLGFDEGHEPLGLRKLSRRYRVCYEKARARRLSIIEKLSEAAEKSC